VSGLRAEPDRREAGQWTPLTVDFAVPDPRPDVVLTLANDSAFDVPVWFDDVALEELPTPR
jgi:hypothetical protein